jgi:hypothetical protein
MKKKMHKIIGKSRNLQNNKPCNEIEILKFIFVCWMPKQFKLSM